MVFKKAAKWHSLIYPPCQRLQTQLLETLVVQYVMLEDLDPQQKKQAKGIEQPTELYTFRQIGRG